MSFSLRKYSHELNRQLRLAFSLCFILFVFHKTISHAYLRRSDHTQTSIEFSDAKSNIPHAEQAKNTYSPSSLLDGHLSGNTSLENEPVVRDPSLQAHEIALIMKTGYAVYKDRLRSQLKTFASSSHGRDENNTIIIADFLGRTNGWNIRDVIGDLVSTNPALISHEKYRMYQQVTNEIREGVHLTPSVEPGTNNAGWSLDALKFIPGYKAAFDHFPHAKFFVGIDDDTFVIWNSLMSFLSLLDPSRPLFLGTPAVMLQNNQTFLHGGSIVIISAAAMKARFAEARVTLESFNAKALELCCGDGMRS